MASYIMAHDLGTSSDKAALVDFEGNIIATAKEDYPTFYPQPAWVEQEPMDYWNASCKASARIIEEQGIDPSDVKGVVFSTQAQGIIPVDEKGELLYRNITWVDGRAEKQAKAIMRKVGGEKIFKMFSGTPIMGKDVLAKVIWLKEERPQLWQRIYKILDVNGWMKYKCTGKMVTEISGASAFALDLKKKEWMSVLKMVGMDMEKLPSLVTSTDLVGVLLPEAAAQMGLCQGTPVFGGCDDVQAAAVGSGMVGDGDCHIYLGTSAWVSVATRDKDKFKHGAAPIQSADKEMLLIAGITESAGANLQWMIDNFFSAELEKYGEAGIWEYLNEQVSGVPAGSDHLVITPWMLGERCPVSDTTARATIYNLSMDHTKAHFMKALYEGIAYNLRWIMENYRSDYGFTCDNFRVIGGGALNEPWMQILADVTGRSFEVLDDPRNSGALGAAVVAMIGLGHLGGFEEVKQFVHVKKQYHPNEQQKSVYDSLFEDYKQVYYSLKKPYARSNAKRFEGEI